MPSPALVVTPDHARCFMLRALGLTTPFPDVATALAHHGYVQLDPINTCGRMHDLILRNRIAGYREGDLLRHVHGADPTQRLAPDSRTAFEHYLDVLAVLPLDAWPYLVAKMRARARQNGGWAGKLTAAEARLAERILAAITERGPLMSDDIDHAARSRTAWNSPAREVKVVLEKLFLHGRVLITTRRAFRRVYDLPERVLPRTALAHPQPSAEEDRRWLLHTRLRQRRLVRLSPRDHASIADLVQPVRIVGCALLYCLREDAALFDEVTTSPAPDGAPRLLAPLDPVIYDRTVTRQLWDFDYTWEVYTPPTRRVRGYYALPVLTGVEISGYVDPKADRARQRLVVISRRVKRGIATKPAVDGLARFLGLR